MIFRSLSLMLVLIGLVGCVGAVPQAIREASTASPTLTDARESPARHLGRRVRWGGSILRVRNLARVTEIEVLARPLNRFGEPDADAQSLGRFIAEFPGFRDPTDYPSERLLTIVGILVTVETRPVGEFPYRYPVVAIETLHLWPKPIPRYPYPAPYPWYGPWPGIYRTPWYLPWD
ncbi:Slp family lipoprotein [Thiocystis violascens]|uniref:Starvation-inducible outer membrane lipoprotein n=1 Tax=Thiocystis violascens (strain ATCC 17096 / DSM 198 / 6111) TaxID=765911 RepID=I3Y7Y1_THIV6|nr:Slp family lipoprotein [Thiocystis violascens]AFL73099.1 starvation-inducible outer membrane lipoprotein [Thiocystis violascens DSM 198]